MKRIILIASLLLSLHASSQNAIFNGGNGDGFAINGYAEIAGNIFNGGNGDGWATAVNMINLPVHFTYFKANAIGSAVLLQWQTSSEQDADRFEIERSEDGMHFNYLSRITATGAGNVATTYEYTDKSPFPGDNYYRLKQVDHNGTYVYTPIKLVSMDKFQVHTLVVYPQPAKDIVTVKLPPGVDGKNVVMNIINSGGALEKQLMSTSARSDNTLLLPLGHLAKGIYFLHLHSGNKVYVSPLVVD